MQLSESQAAGVHDRPDRRESFIDEDADGGDQRRQSGDDPGGDGRHDIPGAFLIKNESQGVGSSRDGDRGIFRIGDAADLDFESVGHD